MTGYGKAEIHFNGKKIHAEIKSLNSKTSTFQHASPPFIGKRKWR